MLVTAMTYNMCDWGRPGQEERNRKAVDIVRQQQPHILFGQEYFLPSGADANQVAGRFAELAGMDGHAAVAGNHSWREGDGYACLAVGIAWRYPIKAQPNSWRVISPERFQVALAGITLAIEDTQIDAFVYHGPARLGREETMVEGLRVAEAQMVAEALTGEGSNPLGLVAGDWNTLGADHTPDGGYYHPDPVFPESLTEAARQLACSRATGEVLWRAGLVSAAAYLGVPLMPSTGHVPWAEWKGTNYGRRLIDEGFFTGGLAPALVDHWVVDSPETRAASDHLPVMFTFDTRRIADNEDAATAGGTNA